MSTTRSCQPLNSPCCDRFDPNSFCAPNIPDCLDCDPSFSKFHWVVPALEEADTVPGLPKDVFARGDQVLLMWATGREEAHRLFGTATRTLQ